MTSEQYGRVHDGGGQESLGDYEVSDSGPEGSSTLNRPLVLSSFYRKSCWCSERPSTGAGPHTSSTVELALESTCKLSCHFRSFRKIESTASQGLRGRSASEGPGERAELCIANEPPGGTDAPWLPDRRLMVRTQGPVLCRPCSRPGMPCSPGVQHDQDAGRSLLKSGPSSRQSPPPILLSPGG